MSNRAKRRLRNQIEEILDQRDGNLHTVLVQAEVDNDDRYERIMRVTAEAMRKLSVSKSARAFFPLDADALVPGRRVGGYPSGAAKVRERRLGHSSLKVSAAAARTISAKALQPLLSIDGAKRPTTPARGRRRARGAVPLWAARAVVMRLTTAELQKLVSEDRPIRGIFANRQVRVPPVMKTDAARLPWEVQENKASTWGLQTIGALAVWGAYGARGKGSRVAILDTGVDDTHADLRHGRTRKVSHFAEFDDQGVEVPGAKPHDTSNHGTHCAGTVVGGNASGRWLGVAPEATVASGLVLHGDAGTDASVLAGLEWAIDLGVDAISMSLGGFTLSPEMPDTYTEAIVNAYLAGIPVVIAAGNDGSQTAGSPGSDLFALTVGATDHRDRAAGFSGGRTLVCMESQWVDPKSLPLVYSKPDVSAPGVDVLSAVPGGGYEVLNGTSMATPHVAGAIALLLSATNIKRRTSKDADRTSLIQQLMTASALELGEAGQNHRFGWGRIDILKAVGFAKEAGY